MTTFHCDSTPSPFVAVMLTGALLGGCSLLPKTDGVAIDHPSGLDGIRDEFRITALHPEGSTPLIEQTLPQLRKSDPGHRLQGTTYDLSKGNTLTANWLIQSPNAWDQRAANVPVAALDCHECDEKFHLTACSAVAPCAVGTCAPLQASIARPGDSARSFCLGHSDILIDRLYEPVSRAQHVVDITLLQPPPDARFLAGCITHSACWQPVGATLRSGFWWVRTLRAA